MAKYSDMKRSYRFDIERHRKFTLSLACIVFFLIGAPLGAIVKKGGIGLPAVYSIILFILYYVIDNTGYKMARDGVWQVWQGVWLSTIVLLPLGLFLTYEAAHDRSINISLPSFLKRKKKDGTDNDDFVAPEQFLSEGNDEQEPTKS